MLLMAQPPPEDGECSNLVLTRCLHTRAPRRGALYRRRPPSARRRAFCATAVSPSG